MVTWPATTNNDGSAVTAYRIKFLESNGLTLVTTSACDGTLASVISSRTCTFSTATLMTSPFNLAIGSLVVAQVEALNAIGYSTPSVSNTVGASAQTTP